jgi:hypothetical protein
LKLLLILLTTSHFVSARNYNYEDIPLGEKSFGMGHACMAVPGDVANMYYNPATLAYIESSQVSASLSAYERIDTRTGAYVSLFQSARDNITRGGFVAVPSMVGGNLKWGAWQWGGAILIPSSFQNSGTVDINAKDAASFEAKYDSLWAGMFVARKWGKHNFGLSLFYANTEIDEKFFFITTSVSPVEIRFVNRSTSSSGLVAVLGGTYDVDEKWTIGYSLRTPGVAIGGDGEFADATSGALTNSAADSFKSNFFPSPLRLSVGTAWRYSSLWLFAADLHFYGPASGNYSPSGNSLFQHDAKAIANVMLGAEYFAFPGIGFRIGFFSDMSAAKNVPTILTALDDKVHMFGGTAAVSFDKPTGSISLGGYVIGGQGSSPSLTQNPTTTRRSNYVYGFVVGSNYKF